MPILVEAPVEPVSDAEFERIDYEVMGLAYNIHNRKPSCTSSADGRGRRDR